MEQPLAYGSRDVGAVTLAGIVRRVLRGTRVLAACGVAGGGLALAYLAVTPPTYQAEARLLIDPRPLRLPDQDTAPAPLDGDTAIARLANEVRVMHSDPVLLAVIDRLHLDEDQEFRRPDRPLADRVSRLVPPWSGTPPVPACTAGGQADDCPDGPRLTALRRLRRAVTIRRENGSFVVTVQARSEAPAEATRIADAVVSVSLAETRRREAERLATARDGLEAVLPVLQARLRTADAQYDAAVQRFGAVGGSAGDLDTQQLAGAMRDLVDARVRTETARARSEQLSRSDLDGESFPDDRVLEALRLQGASLDRRQVAAATLGPRHPDVAVLAEQRAQSRALTRQELARAADAAHADYDRARAAEQLLKTRVDALGRRAAENAQARVALNELARVAEADGDALQAASRRAAELGADSAAGVANIRLLGPASTPRGPATPRAGFVAVSVVAGLTAGAAFLAATARPLRAGTPAPESTGRP